MERKSMLNYLIISGSGKKVGKTYLGEALIAHFAAQTSIVALKISPHRHDKVGKVTLVSEEDGYRLFREWEGHAKNSGRFLDAGAFSSFFLETEDGALPLALNYFATHCNLMNHPVICETGALGLVIKPGVLLFIADTDSPIDRHKEAIRELSDIELPARVFSTSEVIDRIEWREDRWWLKEVY